MDLGYRNWSLGGFLGHRVSDDEKAKGMRRRFIKEGRPLVRPELSEEWEAWVIERTEDRYSARIVDSTIKVMKALTEGKTPREAEKIIDGGISEVIAESTAIAVVYFHPKGEDFGNYWKDQAALTSTQEGSVHGAVQNWY